jgi:hypothetical protein
MDINKDIAKAKKKLIAKAKKSGLYENFGEKEHNTLVNKYGIERPELRDFFNWCIDLDLSYLNEL